MKVLDRIVSVAQEEVWEWKEEVFRDIKDKTFEEKRVYFNKGLNKAVTIIKGKLKKNPDGTYLII